MERPALERLAALASQEWRGDRRGCRWSGVSPTRPNGGGFSALPQRRLARAVRRCVRLRPAHRRAVGVLSPTNAMSPVRGNALPPRIEPLFLFGSDVREIKNEQKPRSNVSLDTGAAWGRTPRGVAWSSAPAPDATTRGVRGPGTGPPSSPPCPRPRWGGRRKSPARSPSSTFLAEHRRVA